MPHVSTVPHDPSIKMLHGPFHHKAHDHCHQNDPWPLSSQCSSTTFITMLNPTCHHNAQCLVSTMLLGLIIKMLHALVITMLQIPSHHSAPGSCQHNAPWPLSSQCSMTPVITMLQNFCHHNAPCPCHHNDPWHLSSQCSMAYVITILHSPSHHSAPWYFSWQF